MPAVALTGAPPAAHQIGSRRVQSLAEFGTEVGNNPIYSLDIDYGPVLEEIDIAILTPAVEANFNSASDAGDKAWPPRKNIGDGHPLLIDTGDLKTAALYGTRLENTQTHVHGVLGTIPYAAVHEFGSLSQNIPPRPYMNVSDKTADEMAERVADFLVARLSGW